MGTYTKNLKLETPNYTDSADIPALAKKNNDIIDSEMIKRANGLDYNEQTGVLQLTGNNSKVGSPIQIKNNLPVTSMASGTELKVNNYKQLIKFTKEGKTEQKTYTGKNIFDYVSNLKASSSGLTSVINDDGSITTAGKPTSNYTTITKGVELNDLLEDGETYTISQEKYNTNIYIQITARKKDGTYTYHGTANTQKKASIKVDKTIYSNYYCSIQSNSTSNWGDKSLTITNKYMICKGTDTADSSFEPYVGGQVSPSPNYPQKIKNVRGVENILPNSLAQGSWNTTNTLTRVANYSNVYLKAGTYVFSSDIDITKYKVWLGTSTKKLPHTDWNIINEIQSWIPLKKYTFTIKNDGYFLVMYRKADDSNITPSELSNLKQQLEEGSIAHDFVPYGSNYLQLENVGENILNIDETPFTVKKITSQGNVLYWSGYSGVNDFVKVKEKTTYKFSSNEVNKVCYIDYYDKNKNYLSRTGTAVDYFTTPENCKYIKFAISLELIPTNAQLMEGTIIKPYEPYKEKIINVDLKGNNLCSNKDKSVKDELLVENGKAKINKKISKIVLDGTENWVYDSTYKYFKCPTYDFETKAPIFNAKQLSNYFSITNSWTTFRDSITQNCMFAIQNTSYKICIRDLSCTSIDEFKTKLKSLYDAGTPVIIQYELAEPKVIDLGEVDLDLLENSTLTCDEESDMQIDYLTISSNIFVQDSLDGNSNQKAPSIDAIKKYFGKKVYDKDANGWIKIEFFDHIEYVYTAVVNKTFNSGWGYTDNVPFPVGVSSLGDRILTSSVICTDAAIKLNAGQYHNGKQGIGINYTNNYETALTKECIYDFRILEYK